MGIVRRDDLAQIAQDGPSMCCTERMLGQPFRQIRRAPAASQASTTAPASSLQLLSRLLIAPSQCLQSLEQCA